MRIDIGVRWRWDEIGMEMRWGWGGNWDGNYDDNQDKMERKW